MRIGVVWLWLLVWTVEILGCRCECQGATDSRSVCHAATVRVRAGNSMGSGTVFRESTDAIYILTNAHVTGQQMGRRCQVEFWLSGYQSQPIDGHLVAVAFARGGYRDVAVIRVPRASLGGYDPPSIPLAPPNQPGQYQQVYSVGCAAGRWPTAFEGHGLSTSREPGSVVQFVPMPAGGRSGSGIFGLAGDWPQIIGLLTWRSTEEGGHELDGRGERGGYGMAQTHHEVWAALNGERQSRDANIIRIATNDSDEPSHQLVPCQQQLSPIPARPPKQNGQPTPALDSVPNTARDNDIVLRYSDPVAVGPRANPTQVWDDSCPGGQCPTPDQSQPSPRQNWLFPSLPVQPQQAPPIDPIPPPAPEPGSPNWLPWVIAGLLGAAWLVQALKVGSGAVLRAIAEALKNPKNNST